MPNRKKLSPNCSSSSLPLPQLRKPPGSRSTPQHHTERCNTVGTIWDWTLKKDPENAVIFYGGLVSHSTGSEGLVDTKPVLAERSRQYPCIPLSKFQGCCKLSNSATPLFRPSLNSLRLLSTTSSKDIPSACLSDRVPSRDWRSGGPSDSCLHASARGPLSSSRHARGAACTRQ